MCVEVVLKHHGGRVRVDRHPTPSIAARLVLPGFDRAESFVP